MSINTVDMIPVLFTFLDGKLNEEYGSTQYKNLEFLNRHLTTYDFNIEYHLLLEQFNKTNEYLKKINILTETYERHYKHDDQEQEQEQGQEKIRLRRNEQFLQYLEISKNDVKKGFKFINNFNSFFNEYIDIMIKFIVISNNIFFTATTKHAISFFIEIIT